MGKAFVQISSVFAELEAGTTSERSRQMMAYKREREEWVGKVPFGWRLVGKHLERDPEQQRALRTAAKRYVAGEAMTTIARDFGMQHGPLKRMLASARVREVLPDKLAGELAAALVGRRMQRVPSSKQSLLGGIARCGVCGGPMRRSSTRAARQGQWYQYRCPEPGHAGISARILEPYVSKAVLDAVDAGLLTKAIRQRAKLGNVRKASEIEARIELLETDHYVNGKIPAARFKRLRDQLVEQLDAARRQERAVGVKFPEELARNLRERWDDLTIDERRRIIGACLERVEVLPVGAGDRVRLVWRG
jgi:hypothetical protein